MFFPPISYYFSSHYFGRSQVVLSYEIRLLKCSQWCFWGELFVTLNGISQWGTHVSNIGRDQFLYLGFDTVSCWVELTGVGAMDYLLVHWMEDGENRKFIERTLTNQRKWSLLISPLCNTTPILNKLLSSPLRCWTST